MTPPDLAALARARAVPAAVVDFIVYNLGAPAARAALLAVPEVAE